MLELHENGINAGFPCPGPPSPNRVIQSGSHSTANTWPLSTPRLSIIEPQHSDRYKSVNKLLSCRRRPDVALRKIDSARALPDPDWPPIVQDRNTLTKGVADVRFAYYDAAH